MSIGLARAESDDTLEYFAQVSVFIKRINKYKVVLLLSIASYR